MTRTYIISARQFFDNLDFYHGCMLGPIVYIFDRVDSPNPLYIGITGRGGLRFNSHHRVQPENLLKTDTVRVFFFSTLDEAKLYESKLIDKLQPLWNRRGKMSLKQRIKTDPDAVGREGKPTLEDLIRSRVRGQK